MFLTEFPLEKFAKITFDIIAKAFINITFEVLSAHLRAQRIRNSSFLHFFLVNTITLGFGVRVYIHIYLVSIMARLAVSRPSCSRPENVSCNTPSVSTTVAE